MYTTSSIVEALLKGECELKDGVVTIEQAKEDLTYKVLKAAINKAIQGDMAAVTWLDDKGLLKT